MPSRPALLVALGAVALLLVGCTVPAPAPAPTTPTPTEEASEFVDLEVGETGFGANAYFSPANNMDAATWYFAIVENPNRDAVFYAAGITVSLLDASGAVLHSTYHSVDLPPGPTILDGLLVRVDPALVADVVVEVPPASDALPWSSDDLPTFVVSDLAFGPGVETPRITGTVTGTHDADLEDVKIVFLVRDAAGDVIGTDFTYVDALPAGQSAAIDAQWVVTTPPEDGSIEGYAVVPFFKLGIDPRPGS